MFIATPTVATLNNKKLSNGFIGIKYTIVDKLFSRDR